MLLGVRLGGLGGVVLGVQVVTVCRVGVLGGLLMRACSVMLVGLAVVVRRRGMRYALARGGPRTLVMIAALRAVRRPPGTPAHLDRRGDEQGHGRE